VDVRLEDLDHEEILRTREAAIRHRRISAGTGTDGGDILDRMGLRRDGVITQAAQMLYGTRFLPDYPQGRLKMGRFRGTKVTGDILDNKQEHLHAFAMVREGMAFLDRTLPLAAHFVEGEILREDRLPVPPDALREILLNAVMHRDYSDPGSYVAIAVFDDRIEIRSIGRLPPGVTVEMLSGPHLSKLRNPLIADAFHRTGAVEIWGRGTNRVIEECERYGIDPPTFADEGGAVVVTFRSPIGPGSGKEPSQGQVRAQEAQDEAQEAQVELTALEKTILSACRKRQQTGQELLTAAGYSTRSGNFKRSLEKLISQLFIEMTIPDKPRSSKQKYRLTEKGRQLLNDAERIDK
jgi:ATP-dependent DNA helicase RecG